jgi:polyhydroxyalkanoate synthesis regulator phasin
MATLYEGDPLPEPYLAVYPTRETDNPFNEKESFMVKFKKIWIGIASLLAVAVIAAGVWLVVSPTGLSFAQAPSPTPQPGQTTTDKGVYNTYFWNALATRLGVTLDKLKGAFTGASTDTLDQAVKDGKLTQAQADQMKTDLANRASQGDLPGMFGRFGFHGNKGFGGPGFGRGGFGWGRGAFDPASVAKALNMNVTDLMTELQSGKTIAAVAQEKNVDLAQVKTSVLADLKTNLDQAVQAGKLTQAQADQVYSQLDTNFDTLANQPWMMHHGMGKFPGGQVPDNDTPGQEAPGEVAPGEVAPGGATPVATAPTL